MGYFAFPCFPNVQQIPKIVLGLNFLIFFMGILLLANAGLLGTAYNYLKLLVSVQFIDILLGATIKSQIAFIVIAGIWTLLYPILLSLIQLNRLNFPNKISHMLIYFGLIITFAFNFVIAVVNAIASSPSALKPSQLGFPSGNPLVNSSNFQEAIAVMSFIITLPSVSVLLFGYHSKLKLEDPEVTTTNTTERQQVMLENTVSVYNQQPQQIQQQNYPPAHQMMQQNIQQKQSENITTN